MGCAHHHPHRAHRAAATGSRPPAGLSYRFRHWIRWGHSWLDNYHEQDFQITHYSYDVLDRLVQVKDAANNTTTMTYDLLGRKTSMSDPDMGAWSYQYDAVGNLTRQTDARGTIINFQYDALNRLTLKDLPSGTDVNYYYDETGYGKSKGQRTRMTDGSGETKYYYNDARGRLTKEEKYISGSTFVTQWSYDSLDRVVTMTYPDGEVVTTGYDARGRPYSLAGTNTYVSSATYNALGQLNVLDFGAANGAKTTYTYYGQAGVTPPPGYANLPSYRLMELRTVNASGTEIQRLRYGYDNVGNVQKQWNEYGLGEAAETLTFTYDALDRLTNVSGSYSRNYQYNPIGNLTNKAGVTLSYPNPGSVRPHAVITTTQGGSFSYDANGNPSTSLRAGMTSRREATGQPTYSQAFDAENRLQSVTVNGQTTTFVYDGDGARVKKVAPDGITIYVGNYYEVLIPGAPPTIRIKLTTFLP